MISIRVDNSKKCNGEYSLFVSFPYDNYVLDIVRGLSERYWDAEHKVWECNMKALPTLINNLQSYDLLLKLIHMTTRLMDSILVWRMTSGCSVMKWV